MDRSRSQHVLWNNCRASHDDRLSLSLRSIHQSVFHRPSLDMHPTIYSPRPVRPLKRSLESADFAYDKISREKHRRLSSSPLLLPSPDPSEAPLSLPSNHHTKDLSPPAYKRKRLFEDSRSCDAPLKRQRILQPLPGSSPLLSVHKWRSQILRPHNTVRVLFVLKLTLGSDEQVITETADAETSGNAILHIRDGSLRHSICIPPKAIVSLHAFQPNVTTYLSCTPTWGPKSSVPVSRACKYTEGT